MRPRLCLSLCLLPLLPLLVPIPAAAEGAGPLDAATYNQWKQALKTTTATPAGEIRALPGFQVELLRAALPAEGSWVALAFDATGRAVISREDKGLLRLTLPAAPGAPWPAPESLDDTLLEVRGLICEGNSILANANNSRTLVKLTDADGDGRYESRTTLLATPGGVGHGRNQIARHPWGPLWVMAGDDVQLPATVPPVTAPVAGARLFNAAWDRFHWSNSVQPPAGHVLLLRDNEPPELYCSGLRNPFGIAFNEDGEAFTYDADMEWDIGLPWYRPTRVIHLVKGADYGWRGASRPLPAWFPDTWPAVCDIGKGSPTAIMFGTRSKFPRPWRDALFILDWAYGIIHAVHLSPQGATYTGRSEVFLQGRPLNVTSLDFGPDGAMYFVTGGRRTQSGLYRVTWTGEQPAPEVKLLDAALLASAREARRVRHDLEGGITTTVSNGLTSPDPWIRRAARPGLASGLRAPRVELSPGGGAVNASFQLRLQRLEKMPAGPALEACLALTGRMTPGTEENRAGLLTFLISRDWVALSAEDRTTLLRAMQLTLLQGGTPPAGDLLTALSGFLHRAVPAGQPHPDMLGSELLIYLGSPQAVAKTLALLEKAGTQEERLHYLFTLRHVKSGWTLEQRRAWLAAFRRESARSTGGHHLALTLRYCRAEFEATLTPEEKTALTSELAALDPSATAVPAAAPRAFVKAWTQAELEPQLPGAAAADRDLKRGRELFTSQCAACHRYGPEGGVIGPDLTGIAGRFDRRTILESILDPWRVVADPYRVATATLPNGEIVSGRVTGDDGTTLSIEVNPVDPDASRRVKRTEATALSITSLMPPGLANTMTAAEVLDLLAFLERGAAP